jgi:hypothetical protein
MLVTQAVERGDWIIIEGANQGDLTPKYVTIGDFRKPAFVDHTRYMIRCPNELENGNYVVSLDGKTLGEIMVF